MSIIYEPTVGFGECKICKMPADLWCGACPACLPRVEAREFYDAWGNLCFFSMWDKNNPENAWNVRNILDV